MNRTVKLLARTAAASLAASFSLLPAAPPASASVLAAAPASGGLPAHPKDLKYGELKFDVPKGDKSRFTLKNGIVVYVIEDHALPLVNISVKVKTGTFVAPADKTGLASLTGTMMRKGGTEKMTAEDFDEKADFLAANISSFIGDTSGGASLNCLSSVLNPSLDLFFDMLRSPRFQQSRIDV